MYVCILKKKPVNDDVNLGILKYWYLPDFPSGPVAKTVNSYAGDPG